MAKLEGVKTLDMVNGEITKVEYNGEVYEKVDTPKKGDIGLFKEAACVSSLEGIPVFTEIIDVDGAGDPLVSSELGTAWFSEYLTYFRKPSAPSLKVGDKVRLISENPEYGFGLARVGDVGEVRKVTGEDVVVDFPIHSHWNGILADLELVEEAQPTKGLFAKVNRPNNVPITGDYVEFRDDIAEDCSAFLTVGKKYEVERVDAFGGADITDDNGDYESAEPDEIKAIYVKYTQEQAEKKAEIGDKILVVDAKETGGNYGNGNILTVRLSSSVGVFVEEFARGLRNEEFIVLNPEQFGEAVEEPEVEESQAEGVPFEVGQFVVEEGSDRYTYTIPEAGALEVVEVGEFILGGDIRVKFHREFKGKYGAVVGKGVTFPVNSDYFRLATDEEIVEALGLNEIKEGDKVEVLAENHPLLSKGATFTVTDVDENVVMGDGVYVAFTYNGKPRLKLVEKGEKQPEIKSKDLPVGTKVRGKGSGDTYTLYGRSPEYDGNYGKAYYVDKNKYGWLGEEQFEVISKPQEIEEGDLVRVVDSPGALPNGSVFKVTKVEEYGDIRGRRENSDEYDYHYAPHHVELVAKAADVYV